MDADFEEDLKNALFLETFIQDWNDSRLDMFALSVVGPEKNVFAGVMRFYFQDRGLKAVTKCIRVTSKQTVKDIMPILIEKFCPDMKMLSMPNYELFEIHSTGDVRKLGMKDKPLIVQCQWQKGDREGRFVLKSADLKIQPQKFFEVNIDEGQLRRRLSRREKKDLKKRRKEELERRNKSQATLLADRVYRELPESSLTRTISNPEAVMRRRRQQKLEKRMKEFQNKEGPQTGGVLKVFAESLKPEIPYKTILASVKDNAEVVTKAALEKFLLHKEDPSEYCIVMAVIPPDAIGSTGGVAKERVIGPSDCPLAVQNSWPKDKGVITFHLRRKQGLPAKPTPSNRKAERSKSESGPFKVERNKEPPVPKPRPAVAPKPVEKPPVQRPSVDRDNMPFFLELTPEGKEINYKPKLYYIGPQETIIGSSRNPTPGVQYLQLFSPKILASHCSIVNVDGDVSIVPHGPEADVRVNGQRVFDNTILHTGNQVQFGGLHTFRFCNPIEDADSTSVASNRNSTASGEQQPYKMESGKNFNGPGSPPISPEMKELILNEQVGSYVDDEQEVVETTFGVDGDIETTKSTKKNIWSARSAENLLDSEHHQLRDSFRRHRQSAPDLLNMQTSMYADNLLPASLTFLDQGRDAFFAAIISEVNGAAVNFKLAPTYTLYLAARYILSPEYRPGLSPVDRTKMLNSITKRIALTVQQTIQENDYLAGGLAFWMANASELLHFYRQDIDLGPLTQPSQAILAQSIQESFALLVNAMEEELSLALPAFLDPSDSVDIHPVELDNILNDDLLERAESTDLLNWTNEDSDRTFRVNLGPKGRAMGGDQWVSPATRIRHHGSPIMADILYILSSAMSLLRRCRVNAALTIQLFSQLFHYINMWVFNRIVLEPDLRLCTRLWGECLKIRLSYIEAWAERQGLELAAECHLARVIQAVHLLEASKETPEEIADVASFCFKLNSLQLRVLMENYLPEEGEAIIPQELIETIVAMAERTSDELSQDDGYDIKLEEDIQLQLPFLLPEEGYSSDIIRGIPPGLQEFLDPLSDTGLCTLRMNPQSQGIWTVYQEPYSLEDEVDHGDGPAAEELPVDRITIDKGKGGLGLSICAAKGAQSDFTGIYIKAVIKGGLAEKDGRLHAGDQILKVNEVGLVDVTQTQAAKAMGKSGPVITLEVIKGAAFYHGLSKLVQDEEKKEISHSRGNSEDRGRQSPPSKPAPPPTAPKPKIDQPLETNIDENSDVTPEDVPHDSDYDSDGNILTPEEKARRARQRQRQIEYEERLAKWEAERIEQEKRQKEEEERMALEVAAQEEERRLEEEAERRYEEDVKRKRKEREEQEEAERRRIRREEEEQRHAREEEEKMLEEMRRWEAEEAMRLEEEERLRREEEERIRLEEEAMEKLRLEDERRKEEEARIKREKEEEERRRQEEERRLFEERRRQEEERRRQEEERRRLDEERRRLEEERRRQEEDEKRRLREEEERLRYEEEQERRRAEEERRRADERKRREDEERRDRLQRLREEERRLQAEAQREREEKLKNDRLMEERRRKEAEEARNKRKEAEDRRQREYERQMEKTRLENERIERERLEREESERRMRETKNKSYTPERDLNDEMDSIDNALREAERIAAEMDLFLFEEEQKIEADSKKKRAKEEQEWKSTSFQADDTSPSQTSKVYHIESKPLRRTASTENILETNLDSIDNEFPAPPPSMLDNDASSLDNKYKYETNIDSSDDEPNSSFNSDQKRYSQYDWAEQQREKKERQREELDRLRQERLKRHESEETHNVKPPVESRKPSFPNKPHGYHPPPPATKPKYTQNSKPQPPPAKPNYYVSNTRSPSNNHHIEYSPNRNTVKLVAQLSQGSDDEDAPPRPPPPRSSPRTPSGSAANSSRFSYSTSNGLSNNHSRSGSNSSSLSQDYSSSGLVSRSGGVYNKSTPPPATVNQGVGEPEVLDFRAKMKLFGKFQH